MVVIHDMQEHRFKIEDLKVYAIWNTLRTEITSLPFFIL